MISKSEKRKLIHTLANMKYRCNNPNSKDYPYYGARGIRVSEEWDKSKAFIQWSLDNGYKPGLTIDRIDVDGNYEPCNCRWVSFETQARNKRTYNARTTGVRGVHIEHGKFRAIIYVHNKRINIGMFNNLEDAIAARKAAEIKYWECEQ